MDSEKPIQNETSPHADGESNKQPDKTKPDISTASTISKSPPTKPHYEITCKQEKHWWDKVKPFVEMLGIALLAIYTGFTIKMYYANRDAAEAAKSAAGAAGRSADEAKNANDFARDALVRVQRALIVVNHVPDMQTTNDRGQQSMWFNF